MNRARAYDILGLNPKETHSIDTIKKHYRIRILKYHPDKNTDPDAASMFRETRSAYEYLSTTWSDPDEDSHKHTSYEEILKSFISSLFKEEGGESSILSKIGEMLMKRLIRVCNTNITEYLKKIDAKILKKVYDLLHKYQDVFHISDTFLESIKDILREPIAECILLNPSLEDLFAENVYKLKHESSTFLVPLWHQDLVYDHQGQDLHVKCFPVLPDNMELDEWNNLYVYLEFHLLEIFGKTSVDVHIGGRIYKFNPKHLRLTEDAQEIECEHDGIAYINQKNMFDVSQKQAIYFVVRITQ